MIQRKIIIIIIILIFIPFILIQLNVIKDNQINSFEDCVAAGNPIMESYPRQCKVNEEIFVDIIEEPFYQDRIIGGERDKDGCLTSAGYSFNEYVGACIKEWELNEIRKKVAKIAVDYFGSEKSLTILDVHKSLGEGNFLIKLEKDYGNKRKTISIENWKIKE